MLPPVRTLNESVMRDNAACIVCLARMLCHRVVNQARTYNDSLRGRISTNLIPHNVVVVPVCIDDVPDWFRRSVSVVYPGLPWQSPASAGMRPHIQLSPEQMSGGRNASQEASKKIHPAAWLGDLEAKARIQVAAHACERVSISPVSTSG